MTTARQVEALVHPLLARHPDLVYVRRTLCIRPVGHFVRMIRFEPCSPADECMPQWTLRPTFLPNAGMAPMIGGCFDNIYSFQAIDGRWTWSDPVLAAELAERIDAYALLMLRSLDTFEKCLWFGIGHVTGRRILHPRERLVTAIADGDLDAARRIWAEIGPSLVPDGVPSDPRPRADDEPYRRIGPLLLADDRAALSQLLHAWEAANLGSSPFEPIWEPSPFPLDAGL